MMGMLLLAGVVLLLIGGAVSTITVEAAPGQPPRRPLTPAAARAWDVISVLLMLAGLVCAAWGGISLIVTEVASW